jgi:molecular chaperone DnaK (HSP70)
MVTLGDRTVVAPSVVYAREDGTLMTGDAAARRSVVDLGRIARGFKRRLGDPTPVMLGETPHSVAALLACVLRDVVRTVIDTEGANPRGVLLTHPANWGPYRRELFAEVPRLAGLDDVRTVTEPEAAAAYYAAYRNLGDGAVVAVYDLGGGTFDSTVVRMRVGGMEILGCPEGIERLGGVDFDDAVLAHVDHALGGAISQLDPRDPHQATTLHRLRQDCVEAKEILSVDTDTTFPVLLPNRHAEVKLGRAEFEDMIRAPIDSTIEALRRALVSARVDPADLAAVVLVGRERHPDRVALHARAAAIRDGRPRWPPSLYQLLRDQRTEQHRGSTGHRHQRHHGQRAGRAASLRARGHAQRPRGVRAQSQRCGAFRHQHGHQRRRRRDPGQAQPALGHLHGRRAYRLRR